MFLLGNNFENPLPIYALCTFEQKMSMPSEASVTPQNIFPSHPAVYPSWFLYTPRKEDSGERKTAELLIKWRWKRLRLFTLRKITKLGPDKSNVKQTLNWGGLAIYLRGGDKRLSSPLKINSNPQRPPQHCKQHILQDTPCYPVRCTGNCISTGIFCSSTNIWKNNVIHSFLPKTQQTITVFTLFSLIPWALGLHHSHLGVQYKESHIWIRNSMKENVQRTWLTALK